MSFAKEQGLKPNIKTASYQFTDNEIIALLSNYIQKETGLELTFHVEESFDVGISTFSVRLDDIYFDDSYEMTREQEHKLFEKWDMDLYYCDKVIAEIFNENLDDIILHYDEFHKIYEIIIRKS